MTTEDLPRGVSREADGQLLARVKVGQARPVRRFPSETDLAVVTNWIELTRLALTAQRLDYGEAPIVAHPPARNGRSTLDARVARYLPPIAGRPRPKAEPSHLRAWPGAA